MTLRVLHTQRDLYERYSLHTRPFRALFSPHSTFSSAFLLTATFCTSAPDRVPPSSLSLAFSHTSAFQARLLSSAPDLSSGLSRPVPGPAFPRTHRAPPSSGASHPSPPIGRGHAALPSAFLALGIGRSGRKVHFYRTVTHVGVSAGYLADTEPQQRFTRAFWRETSPRHVASPSIPRGMSPHGARWMASAVDGVCRGGGVVASLMCGVEYDASLKFVVLLFAPKEQKIKKNTT